MLGLVANGITAWTGYKYIRIYMCIHIYIYIYVHMHMLELGPAGVTLWPHVVTSTDIEPLSACASVSIETVSSLGV